ncbi:hypothetical protein [Hymenobacter volaticus]|nr:hypothetical protein [Hymenobacter volaticus]
MAKLLAAEEDAEHNCLFKLLAVLKALQQVLDMILHKTAVKSEKPSI